MGKTLKSITGTLITLAMAGSVMASSFLSSVDGVPRQLRWREDATIKIGVSTSLFRTAQIKSDTDVRAALRQSLATWEEAANIRFEVVVTDDQTVSPSGPAGDGVNLITIAPSSDNVLLFGKQNESTPATTRIFFDPAGRITEADIVLNPFQQFSTDGTFGTFDLESTLTHEIGHMLGLDHSSIYGSTMYPNHGKNGVYSISQMNARTLSLSDLSSVRGLYPENVLEPDCCGTVYGRLTNSEREAASVAELWLEDVESGRVVASVRASEDGTYRLSGISDGRYRVYGGERSNGRNLTLSEQSDIEIVAGRSVQLNGVLRKTGSSPDAHLIGFNSQLSSVAVRLNAGRSYTLFIGGHDLSAEKVEIGSTSANIAVDAGSVTEQNSDQRLSVLRFEVAIPPDALPGDYSLYVRGRDGAVTVLVGVITVEDLVNPWSNYSIR